jgi:hypothetical protein
MSDLQRACEAPERLTLNGRVLDRRAFLGALSLTVAAGSLLGGRAWRPSSAAHGASCLPLAGGGDLGAWHVDDMWGHMPRYAHPISCAVVHEPMDWDPVAPADWAFVA